MDPKRDETSGLRLMILCGGAPRHLYVANRLCQAAETVAIVQEVGSHPTVEKLLRLLFKPHILFRKLWRSRRERRLQTAVAEARFFFGDAEPLLQRPDLRKTVPHINHADLLALVEKERPQVVAVFGTSLIREPLLNRVGDRLVNLHGGLSPHYRGADCTFWALSNGEPDQVGCTLHFIDPGIDTGRLIAHIRPEVTAADDENSLFWKGVRDSAEAYAELMRRLAGGERLGRVQSEKGALYQVKDRTWSAQRRLDRRLAAGLLDGIHLPGRVEWFTETD